jgi:hypothetical protein
MDCGHCTVRVNRRAAWSPEQALKTAGELGLFDSVKAIEAAIPISA